MSVAATGNDSSCADDICRQDSVLLINIYSHLVTLGNVILMTVSVTLRSQLLNDPIYLNFLAYWKISTPDVTTAREDNVTKTWKYAAT